MLQTLQLSSVIIQLSLIVTQTLSHGCGQKSSFCNTILIKEEKTL